MTEHADLKLCKELYKLTGWDGDPANWYRPMSDGHPLYDLSYLVSKIISGHQIKFRYDKGKVVASAPQMYRFEAGTAEDAACMMAIQLVKNGVLK